MSAIIRLDDRDSRRKAILSIKDSYSPDVKQKCPGIRSDGSTVEISNNYCKFFWLKELYQGKGFF